MNASALLGHEVIRYIIYLDRQCNGAAITAINILKTDALYQYRNLANTKRFKILKDKIFTFNNNISSAGNGTDNDSAQVHKNIVHKGTINCYIPLEFDNTTGALTELKTNNIGIIFWAMQGSRVRLRINSRIRLRFTDF